MSKVNLIITVAVTAVTISLWAYLNRPESEPAWPSTIQGFSFSPMREDQDPLKGIFPTLEEIDSDLALLSGKTHAIRTYTVEGVQSEIPRLAAHHKINVSLGAWVSTDLNKNEIEIQRLIEIARNNRNVVRVTVGNEAVLRGEITVDQLVKYLDRVREALSVPVSTAEPWHVWIKNPDLAAHVDYIGAHMLPYWEGVSLEESVGYVVDRTSELKKAFPGVPVVLSEVGWPSNGRTRKSAIATEAAQATFLRRFLARAKEERYTYYIMEAFDQPWKRKLEGSVGAYWGVYNVYRYPKFEFTKPIVGIPEWPVLAVLSVIIAAITLTILLTDSRTLRSHGRSFLAVVAYAAATSAVWIIYSYSHQYLTPGTVIVGILLVAGMVGVITVLLTEAHEWAEALWVSNRRREFKPLVLEDSKLPKVSVHVAAYNEPPDMVIETLNGLAKLDYPYFEVIVVDNNTKDSAVWQPVEKHCQSLGERFRFFHVDSLAGFKAGALNFALRNTADDAKAVAVIDSDYVVRPGWLRDLASQFTRSEVGIIQAPQDYRDWSDNAFKAMCYTEYKGFFMIGMVTRNDRNAIIQHGTMTLIRKSVLEDVGGWSEWCITEDTELGLKVFELGYEAVYVSNSYGKGLIPDTFTDYKKQRFRWAYGAIQILRRHAGPFFGKTKTKLTLGQRYHFLAGWLPWISDGVNLLFTIAALLWSAAMVIAPRQVDPPLVIFAILPLSLFCFKIGKLIYLYHSRVKATNSQTFAAAVAGLALSHTIARAVISGFLTTNKPFFRTPKMEQAAPLLNALAAAREELFLMLALWFAAIGIGTVQVTGGPDLHLWVVMLMVQSLPYLSAVLMSVVSSMPWLPAAVIHADSVQTETV